MGTLFSKVTINMVSGETDDCNPASLRARAITEEYTVYAPMAFQNYPVDVAPGALEVGDGEINELIAYNRDDTNFITMSWRNPDATTSTARIPPGRSIKIPVIDGDGTVQCSFVADTATCFIDIYMAK